MIESKFAAGHQRPNRFAQPRVRLFAVFGHQVADEELALLGLRMRGGNPPLGLFHASQMARSARLPVVALGGVDARSARCLSGRGFAGIAAVDAFSA